MAANVIESCNELGHDAHLFDYTQWRYINKKISLKNRIMDRLMFSQVAEKINIHLISEIKNGKYDVLLVMKGVHIFPQTIILAKKYVNHVVNWNPDDFFNQLNNSRYLLASFKNYDYIFSSRSHLFDEYRYKGAKMVEMLNWYYLPKYQHPINISLIEKNNFGSDIVFIGTWSRRREKLLDSLEGLNLRIWGSYWNRASDKFKKKFEFRPAIFETDMSKVICSSKININIFTIENRDTSNIRNFEIPACGGFQLCERSPQIMQLFEDGKEIAFYSKPEELKAQCIFYLSNETLREKIKLQGYKRLINDHHTMKDRVRSIMSTLYD
jgi:spore maturation protein CgeB